MLLPRRLRSLWLGGFEDRGGLGRSLRQAVTSPHRQNRNAARTRCDRVGSPSATVGSGFPSDGWPLKYWSAEEGLTGFVSYKRVSFFRSHFSASEIGEFRKYVVYFCRWPQKCKVHFSRVPKSVWFMFGCGKTMYGSFLAVLVENDFLCVDFVHALLDYNDKLCTGVILLVCASCGNLVCS